MFISHRPQRLQHSLGKPLCSRFVLRLLLYTCCFWFAYHPPLYAAPPTPVAPTVADNTPPNAAAADTLQRLNTAATGTVSISVHPTTGAVRFVRVSANGDLLPAVGYQQDQQRTEQVAAKSAAFFARYGALFGLDNADNELKFTAERTDAQAFSHLTYQQHYQNVPVFGGTLRTHFDVAGNLTAVNGIAVPVANVNTTPSVQPLAAETAALAAVAPAQTTTSDPLRAVSTQLYIFQPGLLKGVNGPIYLAYRVEVVNATYSVRRFVFVDAHTGKILLTLHGIHELEREISEGSLANKVWDEGSGNPDPIPAGWASGSTAQITAWNEEIIGAKETYNLFGSLTNGAWLSYDGQNATMRTVNNDPAIQCPNANWNSLSTNYCNGVTGDDTVAHEWGHAYTEYTSNLIYAWQPGALNESFSDIWGEVVDLLNGRGSDSPNTLRTAGSCSTLGAGAPKLDNSYRWLSGEDDPSFGGSIRDMWQPVCYGDPGKVTDTEYTCDPDLEDSGGVHTNSGVPNHLFALLVDGGTYNSRTVSAIGLTRAAHIHWRAQSTYLTEVSGFFDHADALMAACTDLIGQPLYALSTTSPNGAVAPETITAAHCSAVANAIMAVELRTPPSQCDLTPLLDPNAPPLCTAPTTPTNFHQQTWESGLAGWTVGRRALAAPNQFSIPHWSVVGSLPDGRLGQAAFGPNPLGNGDNCQALDESGVIYLQSPSISVPTYAVSPRLAFDHWVATETDWDGGNLEIRVNGGTWTQMAANAFSFNGYNDTLATTGSGNSNPLAGEPAFTGSNHSSVAGSWGQTQVNLSSYARSGDKVELRFELGLDGCNGLVGWYIDDVRAYACTTPPDVSISKQAAPTTALPGQAITYQITAANPNAMPANSVIVTDVLPAGLTVNTFSAGGTLLSSPSPRLVWSFSELAGSSQRIFTVTATVSPTLATDLTLTNTAFVTASNDASATNNMATSTVAVTAPRVGVVNDTVRLSESVGHFSLTIALAAPNPYAPVRVTYATADSNATFGADYVLQNGVAIINPGAMTTTIPFILVNDMLSEPEETFRVLLTAAEGAKILQDSVTLFIIDDDVPGLSITPAGSVTSEDGATVDLQATLTAQPAAPVTVTFTSSDPSEGVVTPQLIFTAQNWNIAQTVTVTGMDDPVDDGDMLYSVSATLASLDPAFAAVKPVMVMVTNRDNEVARLTVIKTVAAPTVTLGSVVTYSYAITNSGNVTISTISAVDDRLGAVPLTHNTLAPNASVRSQLTHVLTIADLPILVNQVTATGTSIGGKQIVGKAQAQVNLLDVELGFTKTVGIAGITPPCPGTDTLQVPVGTMVRYCYSVENRGSISLPSHSLVDDHLGSLLANTAFTLAPGMRYTTSMTATLGVSTTNVATWTSSFLYTTTLPGGELLSKLLTISKHDAATVTVAAATADQDGDTIPDNVEGALDLDKDNLPNFLDTDADNDGLSDQAEAGPDPTHPRDGNGNGIPDYLEASTGGAAKRLFLPLVFR